MLSDKTSPKGYETNFLLKSLIWTDPEKIYIQEFPVKRILLAKAWQQKNILFRINVRNEIESHL